MNQAKLAHNDSTFSMTEEDLEHYVGVLFLAKYHSQPKQHLYRERCNDVEMSIAYQTISKNKVKTIKNICI